MTQSKASRPHALLSVSDKTGLIDLARTLIRHDYILLSTGGTARALTEAGLAVTQVSDHTGFEEIMGGRVKTLHPVIHGGILGRRGIDEAVMAEQGIDAIDLVVVNLYPFEDTIADPDCTLAEAVEQIDIGGPAMVRAAAKNHDRVTIITSPDDYAAVTTALDDGGISADLRQQLAARAYGHTASYDMAISQYLSTQYQVETPERFVTGGKLIQTLRYGENPHQQAAFYQRGPRRPGTLAAASLLQGKPMSYNNIADADAALACVRKLPDQPACVIVKHANPCGVALAEDQLSAYQHAFETDATSAFGGILAFNQTLTATTARAIIDQQFLEVLIAPSVEDEARVILASKKNVRVLQTGPFAADDALPELKAVSGGLLVQDQDQGQLAITDLKVVTDQAPTAAQLRDLVFAWTVARFVKSNAIVYARDQRTIGIGAGQMSRVISARIAGMKATDAGLEVPGSVMASDAFFPFRDGIDMAAEAGIAAVIQPGGSMRDQEVIDAANEHGMVMVFTGMRHFRH